MYIFFMCFKLVKSNFKGGEDEVFEDDYYVEGYDEEACYTIDGNEPNKPCVFPFILRGKYLTTCISGHRRQRQWCSTEVDEYDFHVPGQWGYCSEHCCLQNKFQWAGWSEWHDHCPPRDTRTLIPGNGSSIFGKKMRRRQSTQLVGEKTCHQEQSGSSICCDEVYADTVFEETPFEMGLIKFE